MANDGDQAATDQLHVRVLSPTGVHLEADAQSLTAVNRTGEFDILPGHRNFITLLIPCELRVRPVSGDTKTLDITSGILHVENNEARIFLNIL